MSIGSLTGAPNPLGGSTGAGSAWSNPQILAALLPNYNIAALANAMQAELAVDAIPLDQMSQQVSQLQSQVQAWTQLQTDLQNLQSDASTLASQSLYQGITASSSDPSAVSASATGSGPAGMYQVSVQSLMQPEIDQSAPQSSDSTALNLSGSFSINGSSVNVSSTDTLAQIATAINQAAAGVTAAVLQTTSGSYVLSIASTEGKTIAWADPNGILQSLGVLNSSGSPANQVQAAHPASYTIDGVSEQSPTNSDSTSIPGVTLNFLQLTPSGTTVTISTSQDQGAIVSAFQQLAKDYNTLLGDLNKYAGQGGLLEGSGPILDLAASLYQTLTAVLPGQPAGYQSLDQLGVTISAPVGSPQDLSMQVNTSTLQAALNQNSAAVASLMQGATGIATELGQQLQGLVGAAGTVPASIAQLQQQISSLQQEINDPNSYVNQLIQEQNQQLQAQFQNMISALLLAQSQGQQIQGFLSAQSGGGLGGSGGGSSSGGG